MRKGLVITVVALALLAPLCAYAIGLPKPKIDVPNVGAPSTTDAATSPVSQTASAGGGWEKIRDDMKACCNEIREKLKPADAIKKLKGCASGKGWTCTTTKDQETACWNDTVGGDMCIAAEMMSCNADWCGSCTVNPKSLARFGTCKPDYIK